MKKIKIPETEPKETIFRLGTARKYRFFIMAGLVPVIILGLFLTINALSGRNVVAGIMHSAKDMFFSLLWNTSDKEELLSVIELPEKDANGKNKLTASIAGIPISGSPAGNTKKSSLETALKTTSASAAPKASVKKESVTASVKKPAVAAKIETVKPAECKAPYAPVADKTVIFNEIAWAGAQGKASDEWIELRNVTGAAIKLSGWRIINQAKSLEVIFSASEEIAPGGFFLLERTDDDSVPGIKADKTFTGGIKNSDEKLMLLSQTCVLADEVSAISKWPAGDAVEYRSAERSADYSWHSYSGAGTVGIMGTPSAQNSVPPPPKPVVSTPVAEPAEETIDEEAPPAQSAPVAPKFYKLNVSLISPADGTVKSIAEEIDCEDICSASFKENTEVKLNAYPASDSEFVGWFGACAGATIECSVKMSEARSVSVEFKKKTVAETPAEETENNPPAPEETFPSPESAPATESEPVPEPEQAPAPVAAHLLISEVQITGGTGKTNNEFVELYNPAGTQINLKGYRLVKRTKDGLTDTSIKSWISDAFIPARGYYLWANSAYTEVSPDASTTAGLADDNGIALRFGPMDSGTIIDSLAWGEASNAFVEGVVFMENPGANQSLERMSCGQDELCDTDNNLFDFDINTSPSPRNSSPNQ